MRTLAISLAALCLLATPAPGRAIVAPARLSVQEATQILARAESAIVACVHEERPERAARVRVVVEWLDQRRARNTIIRVHSDVARQCIEAAVRTTFGRNLAKRLHGGATQVSQNFRVPARRTVEPAPRFRLSSIRRAMRRHVHRLRRCVSAQDPSFRGTVNLLLVASPEGEITLRGVTGVETPEILTCLGRVVAGARIDGQRPTEAVEISYALRMR